MHDAGAFRNYEEKSGGSGRWYFSRKEIEENSPSKKGGIDVKKETYLRKSYCTFLQDLGMLLKVPQVTIATAVVFCHRFFLRQSHAKNDRMTISTVCMFLAGKVEETPRPLKDVIVVSFEIINRKDPSASHKIKQREVYEQQKELILQGERVVLATLGFDLNVHHPYKPLVEAIKKFKIAQNTLAQVAWNFVNDGLRTSLCLQFRPHQIAAGAIFLAAKFLKVKLPSDGEKIWWQEFDVTPRQLEEVSNQMLELYEQNKVPGSQGSEAEGSMGTSHHSKPAFTDSAPHKTSIVKPGISLPKPGNMKSAPFHAPPEQSYIKKGCTDTPETAPKFALESTGVDFRDQQQSALGHGHFGEAQKHDGRETEETRGRRHSTERGDGSAGGSPREAVKTIDKDKVKAALKQRKLRGEVGRRAEMMDYEDLIEKELEEGIQVEKHGRVKMRRRSEEEEEEDGYHSFGKDSYHEGLDTDVMEEGEVSTVVNEAAEEPSPKMKWKRKAGNSPERSRVRILLSEREEGCSGEMYLKKTHRR